MATGRPEATETNELSHLKGSCAIIWDLTRWQTQQHSMILNIVWRIRVCDNKRLSNRSNLAYLSINPATFQREVPKMRSNSSPSLSCPTARGTCRIHKDPKASKATGNAARPHPAHAYYEWFLDLIFKCWKLRIWKHNFPNFYTMPHWRRKHSRQVGFAHC